MGADVAETARRSRQGRIGAPRGLPVRLMFERQRQPVLRILDVDEPHIAQHALLDQRPRMPHERIARVRIRDREHEPFLAREPGKRLAFIERHRERLVADHMDAGFEKRRRDPRMQMIRRNDRNRVDAVIACGFRRGHLAKVRIAARQADARRTRRRAFGIGRQRPRNKLEAIVDARRDPVHRADERALAATDHPQPQTPPHVLAPMPSTPRSCSRFAPLPAKSSNARSATRMM